LVNCRIVVEQRNWRLRKKPRLPWPEELSAASGSVLIPLKCDGHKNPAKGANRRRGKFMALSAIV
jgi:hypothetical protein